MRSGRDQRAAPARRNATGAMSIFSPSKEAMKDYTESPLSGPPHFNRRFSADSLPRFGTISNVTSAPSGQAAP